MTGTSVTVEKSEQIVELTIASGGMFFRAEESAVDMNDALDACIDFIIRKIRKNKTKVSKKIRADVIDDYIADNGGRDSSIL